MSSFHNPSELPRRAAQISILLSLAAPTIGCRNSAIPSDLPIHAVVVNGEVLGGKRGEYQGCEPLIRLKHESVVYLQHNASIAPPSTGDAVETTIELHLDVPKRIDSNPPGIYSADRGHWTLTIRYKRDQDRFVIDSSVLSRPSPSPTLIPIQMRSILSEEYKSHEASPIHVSDLWIPDSNKRRLIGFSIHALGNTSQFLLARP